jgi:hypothetical protein
MAVTIFALGARESVKNGDSPQGKQGRDVPGRASSDAAPHPIELVSTRCAAERACVQLMRLILQRFRPEFCAVLGVVSVSAVPWVCAWAELSPTAFLLAIVCVELVWLIIWPRHCMAVWNPETHEPGRQATQELQSGRYLCGVDTVYS